MILYFPVKCKGYLSSSSWLGLLEAGDDRWEVVDFDDGLLLEECVADDRCRVTVVIRPYVMNDGTVFGNLDDSSCCCLLGFVVCGIREPLMFLYVGAELFANAEKGTSAELIWLITGVSCMCSEHIDDQTRICWGGRRLEAR